MYYRNRSEKEQEAYKRAIEEYEARYIARGAVKGADGKFYFSANGKSARSLTALCRELGVDYVRTRERVRRGWSLEEAVNLPDGVRQASRKYFVDPEEHRRVSVAAEMIRVLNHAWEGDAHTVIVRALKIGAAYLKEFK